MPSITTNFMVRSFFFAALYIAISNIYETDAVWTSLQLVPLICIRQREKRTHFRSFGSISRRNIDRKCHVSTLLVHVLINHCGTNGKSLPNLWALPMNWCLELNWIELPDSVRKTFESTINIKSSIFVVQYAEFVWFFVIYTKKKYNFTKNLSSFANILMGPKNAWMCAWRASSNSHFHPLFILIHHCKLCKAFRP